MDDSELDTLERMVHIAAHYETAARALLDMAWIVDGVSDTEREFIVGVSPIAYYLSDADAERVLALTWVADGISDTEAPIAVRLYLIAKSSQTAAERVLAMSWFADGVSDTEAGFIAGLSFMSAATAERVLTLPWFADGVSDNEAGFTLGLGYIALADADAALQVMGMPFLQTLDAADAAALDNLASIAFSDEDMLADILSRPMLKDGITDDEAPIVSMLGWSTDIDGKLLDPDGTTVERRTVTLPLAGEVDLVIVRTRPGARRSMDLLENAVREVENLMGEPLPTRYVGLLYADAFGDSDVAGINVGTHIALLPEYDGDDRSYGAGISPRFIAHEVAHYYWNGGAGWLDEGMAELMSSAIENRRVGTPIDFTNAPCEFARSIAESEALPSKQRWSCSYPLGERLFVSLLRKLDEDAFWEGARNLYAASRGPSGARWLYDMATDRLDSAGIEEVRQAFGADASDVIARWYDGE